MEALQGRLVSDDRGLFTLQIPYFQEAESCPWGVSRLYITGARCWSRWIAWIEQEDVGHCVSSVTVNR